MSEHSREDDGPIVEDGAQLDASDTLDSGPVQDPLDTGVVPPEYAPTHYRHPESWDPRHEETIDERIAQEVADPDSAYGAPDNESGLDVDRLGGDDPDAIDASDDWLGDGEVGARRSGRLIAPDHGILADFDAELLAEDVGVDGGAASAEEAAMHIVDDEFDDEFGDE